MSYDEGVVHCMLKVCLKSLYTNQKLRRVLSCCRVLCNTVGVTQQWVFLTEDAGRSISVQGNTLNLQVQKNEENQFRIEVHQSGKQSVYQRRVDFYSIVGQRNRVQGWNLNWWKHAADRWPTYSTLWCAMCSCSHRSVYNEDAFACQ